MRALSSPLLLLIATIALWTIGRAGILAWDAHVAAGSSPAGALPTSPGLPSAILLPLPPFAAATTSAAGPDNAIRRMRRSHAIGGTQRGRTDAPIHSWAALPVSASNGQFAIVQSALLHALLMPRQRDAWRRSRELNMSRFVSAEWAGTGAMVPAARPGPPQLPVSRSRWAASAWAMYRAQSETQPLSRQGRLGDSQAGMRLGYSLAPMLPAEVFARVTASPAGRGAVDAAAGLSLRAVAALPAALVIERRQRLDGGDARSAFAAYVNGGGTWALPAGMMIDGYGATGVVGFNRRDLFIEGAGRVTRRLTSGGPVRLHAGGGIWGAAQPGASRLDAGPTLVSRLPASSAISPMLAVDYRLRVAGDARPAAGVAITLAADF